MEKERPYRLYPSARLLMFLLVMVGCTILGGGFAAFNFAIVCMVNETAAEGAPSTGNDSGRGETEEELLSEKGYDGEFDWDRSVQAGLLAAHAIGGVALNLPSGLLSDRYGSKTLFGLAVLMSGVASALTPIAAYSGVPWLFAARILEGIGASTAWPPILSMVSQWGTPADAGMLITLGATGYQIGPLIAVSTSGLICDSSLRWPFIFYAWAACCGLFLLVWCFAYTDDPKRCRFISEKELAYVEKHRMRKNSATEPSPWNVPWKAVLSSPCVLATYACQFCFSWANFYISEFMPTYCKEVLRFDVHSNGFVSSLPSLMQILCRSVVGPLADRLAFGGRSATFGTKAFSAVGAFVPSLCFAALAFFDRRYSGWAVASFCLASACLSLSVVGYLKGGVLLAARYAGVIGAIGNAAAYASGVVMPYVTGAMVRRHTAAEWRGTLFLVAGVLALCGIQYQVFGSAEEQPWAGEKKPGRKIFAVDGEGGDASFTS